MEQRILRRQLTAAYQYSFTRLTLNYYTFYEILAEGSGSVARIEELCKRLNGLLKDFLAGEGIEERLRQLRADMTREVEILTAYTDCFQIYEYVLNRMERRFEAVGEIGYDDETFASMLIKFIAKADETAVMNERVKKIIGQLPVRFTRQKFFGLLFDGLRPYIGSPRESLSDLMYILRTESMAQLPSGMAEGYEAYHEILEQFRLADYRSMDQKSYREAVEQMERVSSGLADEADLCVLMEELINDLYVLILSKEDAMVNRKEEELYRLMIGRVLERFLREDVSALGPEEEERLFDLEGRQEAYYERYLRSELPEESEELNQDPDYIRAVNIGRLLSDSSFAPLKEVKTENICSQNPEETPQLVDRAYLEEVVKAYQEELEAVFLKVSRPVARAIMAKVLSDLPLCFHSIDEIKAYILGSLGSCADEAEKETSKELLEALMKYEDYLV